MKKILGQGLILVGLFLGTWWLLSKIEWVSIFRVETISRDAEKKLGELMLEVFQQDSKEIKDSFATRTLDSFVSRICLANGIDRTFIKVHLFSNEDVNAFALPDGHLVVYSGLIGDAKNPAELAGVIAHELAHIQLNHVTQKLVKEIGISALLTLTTGSGNGTAIRELARTLSATAFDRSLETEADKVGVEYLQKARIDPAPLADFLLRMSEKQSELLEYFTWVSTHPDSKERAEKIKELVKLNPVQYDVALTSESWVRLKEITKRNNNDSTK